MVPAVQVAAARVGVRRRVRGAAYDLRVDVIYAKGREACVAALLRQGVGAAVAADLLEERGYRGQVQQLQKACEGRRCEGSARRRTEGVH